MDPEANLFEQLTLARLLVEADTGNINDVQRLAELVLALDGWITSGGVLPRSWLAARRLKHSTQAGASTVLCALLIVALFGALSFAVAAWTVGDRVGAFIGAIVGLVFAIVLISEGGA